MERKYRPLEKGASGRVENQSLRQQTDFERVRLQKINPASIHCSKALKAFHLYK
jgi:hypothetical protein